MCIYIYIYVYLYISIYIYMCIYIYICACVYDCVFPQQEAGREMTLCTLGSTAYTGQLEPKIEVLDQNPHACNSGSQILQGELKGGGPHQYHRCANWCPAQGMLGIPRPCLGTRRYNWRDSSRHKMASNRRFRRWCWAARAARQLPSSGG